MTCPLPELHDDAPAEIPPAYDDDEPRASRAEVDAPRSSRWRDPGPDCPHPLDWYRYPAF